MDLIEQFARWQAEHLKPALEQFPERKSAFLTSSGIPVEPLYASTPDQVDFPGEFPFTRGVQPDHVPRPPLDHAPVRRLRHRRGDQRALPATCSSRARPACRSPSTCPPRSATTPTTPWPRARSARSACRSPPSRTWRPCFDGIPLDKVSTSMTINAPAAILLAHVHRRGQTAGRRDRASCAAPSRTTSSRSTSPAAPTSSRPSPPCG